MIPHKSYFANDPQVPLLRLLLISWAARALGILVHIKGMPVGSNRLMKAQPEPTETT